MTPYFENKSEITLSKYLYQCNTPIGKKAKINLKRWRTTQVLAMLAAAAITVLSFSMDAAPIGYISIVLFVAFVFKLLFERNIRNKKTYRQIIENQPDGKWVRTVTFDKDIRVTDGNTVTSFKYSQFKWFSENDKYYLLFRDENAVLRVEKGCFTTGDEQEFLVFIRKRIKK